MSPLVFHAVLAMLAVSWTPQTSNTDAALRGLCAVSSRVVWASGTKGTWLLTADGGAHWHAGVVPGAEALDFRDIQGFDERSAILLSAGEGAQSRVYRTDDSGGHWRLLFTNPDPKGFFDALSFWDALHGLILGDPVEGRFTIFSSDDGGSSWHRQATPPALAGEGAFAASGTCLTIFGRSDASFATGGGGISRVFHSSDRGRSWSVTTIPIDASTPSAGAFSLAFLNAQRGIVVGGDYRQPQSSRSTIATTEDGGKTWRVPDTHAPSPLSGFRSAVTFMPGRPSTLVAVGTNGSDMSSDDGSTWRRFSEVNLNAVAAASESAVWAVGPQGKVVKLSSFGAPPER